MTDIETQEPLELNTDETTGPYLMVPLPQLYKVRQILQENRIDHVVVEDAIKLDDHPVIAIIDFGRSADPVQIQAVLDAA